MIIYLYIKQHSITGLKYFGRTEKKNPFKYLGSGSYWTNHIKKYGKEYTKTLEIWGFDDQDLCTEFALKFSFDNNIVESKEWANLKYEDGTHYGGLCSEKTKQKISKANTGKLKGKTYEEIHGIKRSAELRKQRSVSTKGKNNSGENNPMFGRKHSDKTKEKLKHHHSTFGHPMLGWKWITNEFDSIKVPPTHILPEGWRYGRKIKKYLV